MKNKVRVKLSVSRKAEGNLIYWVDSIQGALYVPDWNAHGVEVDVVPGENLSVRGAEYLTRADRYELTIVPRHTHF
jgi:hypothetical protein